MALGESVNEQPKPIDILSIVSYLIAAALLLPLGWWLKAHYAKDVGYFILSLGGNLY